MVSAVAMAGSSCTGAVWACPFQEVPLVVNPARLMGMDRFELCVSSSGSVGQGGGGGKATSYVRRVEERVVQRVSRARPQQIVKWNRVLAQRANPDIVYAITRLMKDPAKDERGTRAAVTTFRSIEMEAVGGICQRHPHEALALLELFRNNSRAKVRTASGEWFNYLLNITRHPRDYRKRDQLVQAVRLMERIVRSEDLSVAANIYDLFHSHEDAFGYLAVRAVVYRDNQAMGFLRTLSRTEDHPFQARAKQVYDRFA